MKKLYAVTPKWKKSLVETERFLSEDEDSKRIVTTETLWRSGTFVVALNDEEYKEMLELEDVPLEEYEYATEDTWDGVSFEIYVYDPDITDEEREELREKYEEVNEEEFLNSWLEENGYMSDGCQFHIDCEAIVEEYDDPDGWYAYLLEDEEAEKVDYSL